jgi:hypothetical protein
VSNEVTLEELNKPTDTELASLRCLGSVVNVSIAYGDKMGVGLATGTLTADRLSQVLAELDAGLASYEDDDFLDVHLGWGDGYGSFCAFARVNRRVADYLDKVLRANHVPETSDSEADPEDEHMIRVRLDEGF